jgi:hypothetical protein
MGNLRPGGEEGRSTGAPESGGLETSSHSIEQTPNQSFFFFNSVFSFFFWQYWGLNAGPHTC